MANSDENNPKKSISPWVKFTTAGFQMLVVIGVFTYLGYWLDERAGNTNNIYTALLGLLGVLVALYQLIRAVRKS